MARTRDRCPLCRGPVPPLKVCANETCGKEFYRSEGGYAEAIYCSPSCRQAQAQREYRRRQREQEGTHG